MWCEFYYKQEGYHQHVNEGTCFHQNNCEVLEGFVCKVELFHVCFCMQVLVV